MAAANPRSLASTMLVALVSLAVVGCTAPQIQHASFEPSGPNSISPASPIGGPGLLERPGSLFKEDQAVLSNADFDKILATKVALSPQAKLAVVRFGQLPYWWGWSEDFVRMNEKIDTDFLGRLRTSKQLKDVAYLPSLVTPNEMTIPYLRQAAARFQADLLLIYRTSTQTYNRQKVFTKDQGKAYCTVEAILLDTRTGLVPFSTVVTESYSTTRTGDDADVYEMTARAQQQAIAQSWLRLADQVVAFVGSLPAPVAAQ